MESLLHPEYSQSRIHAQILANPAFRVAVKSRVPLILPLSRTAFFVESRVPRIDPGSYEYKQFTSTHAKYFITAGWDKLYKHVKVMFESCIQAFTTQASVGILILSWLAQKSGFSFEKLRSPSGFEEWRKIDMVDEVDYRLFAIVKTL